MCRNDSPDVAAGEAQFAAVPFNASRTASAAAAKVVASLGFLPASKAELDAERAQSAVQSAAQQAQIAKLTEQIALLNATVSMVSKTGAHLHMHA